MYKSVGRSGAEAVAEFTEAVLAMLYNLETKDAMKLVLSHISPQNLKQIAAAAQEREYYEICQLVKDMLEAK